jgi:hypothetical protein
MAEENQTSSTDSETSNVSGTQKDVVAYESHKKAINQLKETQKQNKELADRLANYERALKEKEESELKEQNKWREMFEKTKEENKKLQESIVYAKKSMENAVKQRAFLDTLGTKIKDDYLTFVDFDSIDLDEKGRIDTDTLESVVNKFKTNYPELLPKQEQKVEHKQEKSLPNKNANPIMPTFSEAKAMKPEDILLLWKKQQQAK